MKKKAEVRTKEQFMLRFKGVKRHILTRALCNLTPGINWGGCSKGHMAEAWAEGGLTWVKLREISLDQITEEVRQIEAGLTT